MGMPQVFSFETLQREEGIQLSLRILFHEQITARNESI